MLAGTVVGGRYRITAALGAGAGGEVYSAFDMNQQEQVALKLLASPPPGWRFGEAVILTALRDEHILAVRNADEHLGQPYLVTELAGNGTLAQATPPHGVEPEQAAQWVRQLCRGVARTHDAGLVHTDVKPDNAFLDDRGHALLGDFGLACRPGPTGQGHVAGTPETMAPEVARALLGLPGGSGTTAGSDVYSLGATLHYLLAGRYAHARGPADTTGSACLAAVVAGPGPSLSDTAPHVPQGLRQRVEQAMSRNPAHRPSTASDLATALGDWPRPARAWRRTDEHGPGHQGCWRGSKPGATELVCCAIPLPRGYAIETRSASGNKVHPACTVAKDAAALPAALRRAWRGA